MKKHWVKVFKVFAVDQYEQSSYDILGSGVTDWEEITTDELIFLKNNLYRLQRYYQPNEYASWVLVEKPKVSIQPTISTLKEMIKKEQEAIEAEKKKAETKKLEAKLKREMKKATTRKELYEELKKEFE